MQREDTNLIINSAVSLLFGPIFINMTRRLYKKFKHNRKLKNEGVKSIAEFHKMTKSKLEAFRDKNSRFKTLSIFIEGSIVSDQPVYMATAANVLVNYTRNTRSKLYQNIHYLSPHFYMTEDFNYNLYIHDRKHHNIMLPLHIEFHKELADLATLVTDRFEYHQPGLIKRILLAINRVSLTFVNGLLNWGFAGLEVGIRDREYIVALHSPIFMYAKIYLDKQTGALSIRAAKFVSSTLKDLTHHVNDLKIKHFVIWTLSGAITYISLRSIAKALYRKYKRLLLLRRLHSGLSAAQGAENTVLADNISCAKCNLKPRNVMFSPCKDLRYCTDCYNAWRSEGNNKCEVCRSTVVGKVELIFS